MVTTYQVLKPSFPSNTSHLDIKIEAKKFSDKYADNDISTFFLYQMLLIKTSFKDKIVHLKSSEEVASFFIVEKSLATSYPDVCTANMMCLTVTVATAE